MLTRSGTQSSRRGNIDHASAGFPSVRCFGTNQVGHEDADRMKDAAHVNVEAELPFSFSDLECWLHNAERTPDENSPRPIKFVTSEIPCWNMKLLRCLRLYQLGCT